MAKKRKVKPKVKLGERLGRLFLLAVGILFVLGVAKALADKQKGKPLVGQSLDLPELSELSIEGLDTDNVLGEIIEKKIKFGSEEQASPEPIVEPVENIQAETQTLIESIKKLPEDQLEAIKKQVFKELCEDYCQERETENE